MKTDVYRAYYIGIHLKYLKMTWLEFFCPKTFAEIVVVHTCLKKKEILMVEILIIQVWIILIWKGCWEEGIYQMTEALENLSNDW